MKRLLILLFLIASPAMSQVIATTGEHGAFTRLVLQFPAAPDWQLGRTERGYELAVDGKTQTYDLSNAFRLIDRQRLKAIWADPETGNLQLGLACPCHVRIDTIGSKILVLDIHDGPPVDQSHEVSLDGHALGPIVETGRVAPKPRPSNPPNKTYDWTSTWSATDRPSSASHQDGPLASQYALDEFRQRLTLQLTSAGSGGFVTMAEDASSAQRSEGQRSGSNFRIGPPEVLTESGETCPNESDLALANWASGANPAQELANARGLILGEFDAISQEQLQQAVRTHLYFGFGAEARNLISAFEYRGDDKELLQALGSLVEGESLASNPFESQHTCSGYAALWALAAQDEKATLLDVNADGIVQTFLALPRHLQLVMAADLGRKLVAAGHPQSAEIIVNAVKRSSDVADAQTHLIAAEVAIMRDDLPRARTELDEIDPGHDTHRTLIARAETAFREGKPPSPDFVTEMDALYFSQGKGPDAKQITRAQALVTVMTGNAKAALGLPGLELETLQDVWSYLAKAGGDGELLAAASTISERELKLLPAPVIEAVITRLVDLGVPALAEDWVAASPVSDELAIRLALERFDAREALLGLEKATFGQVQDMRTLALTQLGDFAASAESLRSAGKSEDALRQSRWSHDWETVLQEGSGPWARLAQMASSQVPEVDQITLAQTTDILANTLQQIDDIEALLIETVPEEPVN